MTPSDDNRGGSDSRHRREADLEAATQLLDMPLAARTRALLARYDLRPRKSLSQNFLVDQAAVDAIVSTATEYTDPDSVIVEIGAGLGALTVPLARTGRRLIAYETDPMLIRPLRLLTAPFSDATIMHRDITEEDLATVTPGHRLAVVGNLPYHLSGLLLRRIMEIGHRCDVAIVTVQAEVGQRLRASAGDSQYGLLSVFARYYLESVEPLRRIGPGAFLPPPQVSSMALALHPRHDPAADAGNLAASQECLLFDLIRAAFGHRRKTLRRSLLTSEHLGLSPDILEEALSISAVDGSLRAEQLDLHLFVRLARALYDIREIRQDEVSP